MHSAPLAASRTWYSHCAGMTSAFTPLMRTPAYMQALRWLSISSRPMAAPEPAAFGRGWEAGTDGKSEE